MAPSRVAPAVTVASVALMVRRWAGGHGSPVSWCVIEQSDDLIEADCLSRDAQMSFVVDSYSGEIVRWRLGMADEEPHAGFRLDQGQTDVNPAGRAQRSSLWPRVALYGQAEAAVRRARICPPLA
jgi:hypothetical protein